MFRMRMARTPDSFDRLAALDKSVHEPARLAILTALSACRCAQFKFLQSLTGLTQGNLSIHLTKLAEKGFIEIEKSFDGRYPATNVRLTAAGRKAISEHWRQLDGLRAAAETIAKDGTRE
jgi:DNA-binding MarR family transcriptional regulator